MFSPLYITIAILILIVFILIIHTFVLEHRLRSLFRGQKGQSLEKVIQDMQNRLNSHNAQAVKNSNDINNLSNRLRSRIRNVSTLRFKPFEDAGSNQSFAIAMIDDESNGVVLSSLDTRDRMSVFAKPIKSGKSEYELTNEEKSVLESAKQETI
ncbi:hypothetical protein A3C57_02215 [Candidatus Nomurabacteria bacterium RIFCSPHIGHO2_02_FULL_33_12]|uniref:DUF4446 domain-containing protein n=1 Tax=Candidatus Nomurabacteria bacterium RIFCSPLOWO2_01_FULL_33_17 TaxID=1801764 RepID=A0A1F6WMN7_9BACT|nr:MAG: hypothetical protein A3C57_02215 [Candidatus Nomurabacteria bacterium RIFCSPHIGHO2_02_FULL_33_12]OGI83143.1 MAG: hypothetical protein A2903_01990 [Candidatus Nomurabacteria bacterium RIFCSPLOWO2_01_FULL_33_17]